MKFNWGTGIVIAMIIFMAISTGMMLIFMNQKVDLVTENYYEKELKFQEEIDRLERTKKTGNEVNIIKENDHLILTFPSGISGKNVSGEIYFYRPSDSSLDFKIPLSLEGDSVLYLKTTDLTKGLWKLKLNWIYDGENYFTEKILNL
ncbi:MAG: FixH family protein [Ignavibacteriaceae bacterium]